LRGLQSGAIPPRPQNHAHASVAPLLKKEDGRIDWRLPAQQIFNRIRGFAPWPGASSTFRGQTCQIWGEPVELETSGAVPRPTPGAILAASDIAGAAIRHGDWMVACGHATLLRLTAVKVEGRKQISASEFANGARLTSGDLFV
jgi:methionyl-tRNA formyltransferase